MSLAELMPLVEKLPRADKQRLLDHLSQRLVADGGEKSIPLIGDCATYTIWNFHENGETAQKLLNYVNEEKAAGRA